MKAFLDTNTHISTMRQSYHARVRKIIHAVSKYAIIHAMSKYANRLNKRGSRVLPERNSGSERGHMKTYARVENTSHKAYRGSAFDQK